MMRHHFDEQLAVLHRELTQMGALCEDAISLAAKALSEGNCALAEKVGPLEEEIDQMERDIETLCLKLLLQQQPVARDLRMVSAAIKMITDMERIGDQASDIAEIIPHLQGRTGDECESIRQMAAAAIRMVTESVTAFVRQDLSIARSAMEHDDFVDECFVSVKQSLINMIAKNPEDGEYALDLLMIAKYIERIGDHAVNVAEWVVFSVTGTHRSNQQSP